MALSLAGWVVSDSACVSQLGCHNQMSWTSWLEQQVFMEAGKSKIKVLADPVSGEDSACLADGHLLTMSSQGRESGRSGFSS